MSASKITRTKVPERRPPSYDRYAHGILTAVEHNGEVSQRSLARELGIALGLTNLLVRNLTHSGLIRIVRIPRNRLRYLLTPAGLKEKARMSRDVLQASITFYMEARNRIRDSFGELSANWPGGNGHPVAKRIIFYGAGEVAEIGYVCLQETDLRLVGVIDEARERPFFGMQVSQPSLLDDPATDQCFDRIVVMSFDHTRREIGRAHV